MYLKYVLIVFLGISVACCADKGDSGNIGEFSSENFKVEVGGESVFVYQARVSKYPINQNWPGYQRPLEQTEIASFASFDYEAGKTVRITTEQKIESCDIRPKEFGIIPEVKGRLSLLSLILVSLLLRLMGIIKLCICSSILRSKYKWIKRIVVFIIMAPEFMKPE